ncbi:isocitrate lyase/phosphoenolpyruvate mutase family protein [Bradyrhizobium diazoefficiens]|uniref:isocitrate lyase/phosphoenolpyruvate mutase family protein n=1 Tax=Bradyrhizobium diazoefficiens TaxID=1355477 RepID=UPI00190C643E|nr:isocitrate lyase/phosphoenolpyruvate mutase family protein [Bradyrhizobium diazoefficiens]MBK3666707.1 isocitrate lyase/phosphoenolpyruvate mutase family protein [Bradyrhizobium diazoefficiens]
MLRAEICSRSTLSFLMEAHDALSGAIAKRAGFKGLWALGLSIASSLGYRDANEAPLHIVDVLKLIDEIATLAVSRETECPRPAPQDEFVLLSGHTPRIPHRARSQR